MTLVRVPVANTVGKTVRIDTDASPGATIGQDLRLPDGTVPSLTELAAALSIEATAPKRSDAYIYWNQILGLYDFIKFDTSYGDTVEEGVLHWDTDVGTLAFGLPGGGHEHFIGQELILRVRNTTGSLIPNGSVVTMTGASGNKPLVALADATDPILGRVFGVTTEDIANNANGYMAKIGLVRGVDTDGLGVGSVLFLDDTTPGGYSPVPPTPPNAFFGVAAVVADHATEGIIFVDVTPIPPLGALSDVVLTGAADNDMLHRVGGCWHDTGGALTFDGTDLGCGGDLSGLTIGGITEANLVDKSASESIGGTWSFNGAALFNNYTALANNQIHYLREVDTTLKVGIFMDVNDDVNVGSSSNDLKLRGTTVDVAAALTATSYGGIAEANLVSKIAAETIVAQWTFDVNPEVDNTSPAYRWIDNDGATDETRFTIRYQSGQVRFQNRTDLDAGPVNWLTMDRTGMVTDDITLTATAIQLVGAVTGTSFGGITEANLLDKTAAEVISAQWAHTKRIQLTGVGFRSIFTDETNTGTDVVKIQAGAGSGAYGASLALFANQHATHPGSFEVGLSQASGGSFQIRNTGWVSGGSIVFSVSQAGKMTPTSYGGKTIVDDVVAEALTGSVNDYAPTGLDTAPLIRITADGNYSITGMVPTTTSRLLWLLNIDSNNTLTLPHESGSSSAANRFLCPGNVDYVMPVRSGVMLYYTSSRWYILDSIA